MELTRQEKKYLDDAMEKACRLVRAIEGPGLSKVSQITSHLHIAPLPALSIRDNLRSHNIQAILVLGGRGLDKKAVAKLTKSGRTYLHLPTGDSGRERLLNFAAPAYDYIQAAVAAEHPIIICCSSGQNLSAVATLYYYLRRYYLTNKTGTPAMRRLIDVETYHLLKIIEFVKDGRPCVEPAQGFIYQLLAIELQMKRQYGQEVAEQVRQLRKKKKKSSSSDDSDSDSDADVWEQEKDVHVDELDAKKPRKKKKTRTKKRAPAPKFDQLVELAAIEHSEDEGKTVEASSSADSDSDDASEDSDSE